MLELRTDYHYYAARPALVRLMIVVFVMMMVMMMMMMVKMMMVTMMTMMMTMMMVSELSLLCWGSLPHYFSVLPELGIE